jgi:alpha-L-fucosidase
LNVGPKADGTFPAESVERLKAVGAWMKSNGEAVYGTKGSPLQPLLWGRCTRKEQNGNTTLYLSVFNWPADGKLVVPGVKNEVRSAVLLATGKKIETKAGDEGLIITLPEKSLDPIATVLKVEVKGTVENLAGSGAKKEMQAGEVH